MALFQPRRSLGVTGVRRVVVGRIASASVVRDVVRCHVKVVTGHVVAVFHVKQSTEARQLTPRQAGRHSLCLPAARANARDMATVKIAKTHHCNA